MIILNIDSVDQKRWSLNELETRPPTELPQREYELHYCLSGSVGFQIGQESIRFQTGQVQLWRPGQIVALELSTAHDNFEAMVVRFGCHDEEVRLLGLMDDGLIGCFPILLRPNDRTVCESIRKRHSDHNPWINTSAAYVLGTLLCDILGQAAKGRDGSLKNYQSSASHYVQQGMALLQGNIQHALALSAVATTLGISEEYLIKLFNRELGMTPMRYFQKIKQEAAIQLLLTTSLSIKEIGWKLGFSSQFHFSRNFKLFSGESPTEFRIRHRQSPTAQTSERQE